MVPIRSRVAMAGRFVRDLGAFLDSPPDPDEAEKRLGTQLKGRSRSLVPMLQHGVFSNPDSPYRALMESAGIDSEMVAAKIDRVGLEATLAWLFEAGVHVSLDEFKGRVPIVRPGLELRSGAGEFDNPLLQSHYEGRTGGSRGVGTRLVIDLGLLAYETDHVQLALEGLGALDRPAALWRPRPPGVTGLKEALYRARLGRPPQVWFAQNRSRWFGEGFGSAMLTLLAILGSRFWGKPLPRPRHVPLDRAVEVARWLAGMVAAGTPALLDTNVSSAVRVCHAARQESLDIAGSIFRSGGEPLTPQRAALIRGAGCSVACNYGVAEAGRLGIACSDAKVVDDVHFLGDKIALLQRPKQLADGSEVAALYITTLHPSTPKLMINVEIGDHAVLERRECGCPFGLAGFSEHLHTIRSYEKLTSEGMHFVGSDLMELLETTLPQQFGGDALDYQLVEREIDGLCRVALVVSPAIGVIDEPHLIETMLDALKVGGQGRGMMSQWWKDGSVLTVERREPYTTGAAKVMPLHLQS
jgi:hypothetical protein